MKNIVVISDMHINSADTHKIAKKHIQSMYDVIVEKIPYGDEIIFFNLGDLTDYDCSRNKEILDYVTELHAFIIELFGKWKTTYYFVPGNHDLFRDTCAVDGFNDVMMSLGYHKLTFDGDHIKSYQLDSLNICLVNTVSHGDSQFGMIDEKELMSKLDLDKLNIVACHHSLLNEDPEGKSAIRGGKGYLNSPHRVIFLNGDTHGHLPTKVTNGWKVGVGSFSKQSVELQHQFNIIRIDDSNRIDGMNYIFLNDESEFKPIRPFGDEDFADIEDLINNLESEKPTDYINRKIQATDSKVHTGTLYEFFEVHKHGLLQNSAASGKTYEVDYLIHQLIANESPLFPWKYKLSSYRGERIIDLMPKDISHLPTRRLFVILDGYDEVGLSYQGAFEKQINIYIHNNPDTKLLITSRVALNRRIIDQINASVKTDTFLSQMIEMSLLPLNDEDIEMYVGTKTDDWDGFFSKVKQCNLIDLLERPFYLVGLVKLYVEEGDLGSRATIIQRLVLKSFKEDTDKYALTYPLSEVREDILSLFRKAGLLMQLMNQEGFSDIEYRKLFHHTDRHILNFSSLWPIDEGGCRFYHNNYREYFIASFLKEQNDIGLVIDLITFADNETVKSSWLNVISFILLMDESNELEKWLLENNPWVFIKLEDDKFEANKKTSIVIQMIEKVKEENIWFRIDGVSDDEIVRFGKSQELISYLLSEIIAPKHFRAQYNALTLISKMSDYHGLKDKVIQVLIASLDVVDIRDHEINQVLSALSKIEGSSVTTAKALVQTFENDYRDYVLLGMYRYLITCKMTDQHFDYLIDGLIYQRKDKSNLVNVGMALEEAIIASSESTSIDALLDYMHKNYNTRAFLGHLDDIYNHAVDCAVSLYSNGYKNYYQQMVGIYKDNHIRFGKQGAIILSFFDKTGTKEALLEELIKEEDYRSYLYRQIFDEDMISHYYALYKKQPNLNEKDFLAAVVFEKTEITENIVRELKDQGVCVDFDEPINYEEIRVNVTAKLINALFSKESFLELIQELIGISGNPDLKCNEVHDIGYDKLKNNEALRRLTWLIHDSDNETPLLEFVESIDDWTDFAVSMLYSELDRGAKFDFSEEQKRVIITYCQEDADTIDIPKQVSYTKQGQISYSKKSAVLSFWGCHFSFSYSNDALLDMLTWPSFLFDESEDGIAAYLLERLNVEDIHHRTKENIEMGIVIGELAVQYIKYCHEGHYEWATVLAEDFISDDEASLTDIYRSIEYIKSVYGTKYIIEKYLKEANVTVLHSTIQLLRDEKPVDLIQYLEELHREEFEGKINYIYDLVSMESIYGLEMYYKMAKDSKRQPLPPEDTYYSHEIMNALGNVSKIEMLPIIRKLICLRFSEGFNDIDHFSLYSALSNAVRGLAKVDYEAVSKELSDILQKTSENDDLVSFCNTCLNSIKDNHNYSREVSLTIQEAFKKTRDYIF